MSSSRRNKANVYPCRVAYAADNETVEGIRSSLQEIEDNEKMEEEEEERVQIPRDDPIDEFPDTSEGEPHTSNPEVSSSSRSRMT